jgi:uncharacterized membrane protein HdeD (DUF308 family)
MSSTPLPTFVVWVFLIRGSAALFLGVAALAADVDLSRLGTYVAVYWVVAALLTLRWALGSEAEPGRRIAIAAGAIGLAAGVMVLLRKPLSGFVDEGLLLDLLGASATATGLLRLFGRFHDDQLESMRPRMRYRVGIGALEIALGLTLILADEGSAPSIRIALGVWGLVTGTFLILDGLWIRRIRREKEERHTSS